MNRNLKYVIAVHFVLYGAADALEEYLNAKKVEKVLMIRLPFHFQRNLTFTLWSKGKRLGSSRKERGKNFEIINYLTDFFEIFNIVFQQKEKYDVFVGVNNLNALCGLLLKKFGRVDRVIFYGIDFVPVRFQNKILNFIYHKIEEICVKHCDEVWNVSPRMEQGRERILGISARKFKQKVVPIGVWNERIAKTPFSKINKDQLIFVGSILKKQGIQKVIEAIPEVIAKKPTFEFLIIGWGEYEKDLKKMVKDLKIKKHVKFKGLISSRRKLEKEMSKSACAVAPYAPLKDGFYNFSYYADPTKLKDYLSSGLPVILTALPHNAKEIERRKCGIIVDYDSKSFAKAIVSLFSNRKMLQDYRKNAIEFAEEFDWKVIFNRALGF